MPGLTAVEARCCRGWLLWIVAIKHVEVASTRVLALLGATEECPPLVALVWRVITKVPTFVGALLGDDSRDCRHAATTHNGANAKDCRYHILRLTLSCPWRCIGPLEVAAGLVLGVACEVLATSVGTGLGGLLDGGATAPTVGASLLIGPQEEVAFGILRAPVEHATCVVCDLAIETTTLSPSLLAVCEVRDSAG
jgi:hypothetical protein